MATGATVPPRRGGPRALVVILIAIAVIASAIAAALVLTIHPSTGSSSPVHQVPGSTRDVPASGSITEADTLITFSGSTSQVNGILLEVGPASPSTAISVCAVEGVTTTWNWVECNGTGAFKWLDVGSINDCLGINTYGSLGFSLAVIIPVRHAGRKLTGRIRTVVRHSSVLSR